VAKLAVNFPRVPKVRLNEVIINRSECEIDQMALDLLAMEQPMAIASRR
jgi:phosphate uptake regulator